jgi:integrase
MSRKRRGRGEGGIYVRGDGVWTASLSLGYDENGKRKRRMVYGRSKVEVQEKLRRICNESTGGYVDTSRLTLSEFLSRWLEGTVKLSRAPTTYASYEGVVRNHISNCIGGIRLQLLEPLQVQNLYSVMEKKGASARMRQLTHAVLHKALDQAVRWHLLRYNPSDAIERPKVPRKEMTVLSQQQMQTLMSITRPHRLWALFVMAITTGMRQGELFGLMWGDIDVDAGTVFIQRTLEEIDGRFRTKDPKSAKSRRRVELPAVAIEALHEHRKRMFREGHIAGPVFCDHRGGWLRKSNFIRQVFKPMLQKAGLPEVRFHDLRHSHATMLLTLGENPKVVQERLGHSQISLTLDTYSHVLPTVQRAAAAKIDQAFRKAADG